MPSDIAFIGEDFSPAIRDIEPPKSGKVVEVAKPLPLPGQLKPAPRKGRKKRGKHQDERPVPERVAAANARARIEPVKDGYVNAIQVYPYTEGALYQLYTAPEQVSDIVLQKGEKIMSVSEATRCAGWSATR